MKKILFCCRQFLPQRTTLMCNVKYTWVMLKHCNRVQHFTVLLLIFSFRVLTLILTFLCYMNYHMTRKAFSAVKVCCSYTDVHNTVAIRTIVLNED